MVNTELKDMIMKSIFLGWSTVSLMEKDDQTEQVFLMKPKENTFLCIATNVLTNQKKGKYEEEVYGFNHNNTLPSAFELQVAINGGQKCVIRKNTQICVKLFIICCPVALFLLLKVFLVLKGM